VLQELSDEEADNCGELESDSDLSDENIDYDNFDIKNIKYYINKSKIFPNNICIKNYLFILRCNKI